LRANNTESTIANLSHCVSDFSEFSDFSDLRCRRLNRAAKSALIYRILERLASLEYRHFACWDLQWLARTGIQSSARSPCFYSEGTEAHNATESPAFNAALTESSTASTARTASAFANPDLLLTASTNSLLFMNYSS
jgi:hypothetical protein